MQAPRGIADKVLEAFPDGLSVSLIANGGRVLVGRSLVDGNSQLVRPALELFHGGGTEGVRRGQENAGALFLQQVAQFGGGGGFSRAVDAYDQNDQRLSLRRSGQGRSGSRKGLAEDFTGGFHQVFRIQSLAFPQLVRNVHGAPDADVRSNQVRFQFIPVYPGTAGEFGEEFFKESSHGTG